MYKRWQLNDAQDRLIELLQSGIQEPQIVCDEDNPVAAIISINLFKELMELRNRQHRPTIAELLDELSEIQAREPVDVEVPERKDRPNPTWRRFPTCGGEKMWTTAKEKYPNIK